MIETYLFWSWSKLPSFGDDQTKHVKKRRTMRGKASAQKIQIGHIVRTNASLKYGTMKRYTEQQ